MDKANCIWSGSAVGICDIKYITDKLYRVNNVGEDREAGISIVSLCGRETEEKN